MTTTIETLTLTLTQAQNALTKLGSDIERRLVALYREYRTRMLAAYSEYLGRPVVTIPVIEAHGENRRRLEAILAPVYHNVTSRWCLLKAEIADVQSGWAHVDSADHQIAGRTMVHFMSTRPLWGSVEPDGSQSYEPIYCGPALTAEQWREAAATYASGESMERFPPDGLPRLPHHFTSR